MIFCGLFVGIHMMFLMHINSLKMLMKSLVFSWLKISEFHVEKNGEMMI